MVRSFSLAERNLAMMQTSNFLRESKREGVFTYSGMHDIEEEVFRYLKIILISIIATSFGDTC